MSVINTNIKALIAQNAATYNNRALSTAMQQLSTGSRINSAADDAAGLAISTRMTAQIRGLNQAVRNANDGISLLQTAEGATIEMNNMLQRMRELAVQAASDTNTSDDRAFLNLEYQQLSTEIARIASNTEWNGMNILNNTEVGASVASGAGTAREVKFQVGANSDQTISVVLKDFSYSTGVPAVESEAQFNMLADDFSTAETLTFDIGTTSFSVAITSPAAAAATGAEVGAIAGEIQDIVNNTVGFENVQVLAVGTTISIRDAEGRNVSNFDALDNAAATLGAADPLTVVTTGSAAGAAAIPAAASVFSGSSRINDTVITGRATANAAIVALDAAISSVNEERATIGSVINRLSFAADNLTNVSQNASESRSRVLDTDYAKATTELARTQIIQQAATAMLAQANSQQQTVLALLQ